MDSMRDYRRSNQSTSYRVAILGILALLLIGTTWLGWRLYRVWEAATALRADAQAARSLASGGIGDLDQALPLLHDTHRDLEALQHAAGPLLRVAPYLGWVPRYGATIRAAPTLLDAAIDATAAGTAVVDRLMPLLEEPEGGGSGGPTLLEEATMSLAQARPDLERTLAAVQEARSAWEPLDAEAVPSRLHEEMTMVDRYLPRLEKGLRGALLAPELLGAEGPRTYLLLVQNEDELRATGGFISGVAQLTLDSGRIEKLPFEDSYAVDDFSQPYPEPPAPMRELMLADLWLFRDSNWSPDFPTSARKAIELFHISRDAEIDGVVALDQQAIRLLLGPLGPLPVEGVQEPVTGQNVLQVARRAWAPGNETESDWWRQRKDIMGQVLDAAMQRLEGDMGRDQIVGLSQAALKALGEKHVLVYLRDREAAAVLRGQNWDGALAAPEGDYFMVVDTNVGFNKVNAVVEERLDYVVDLTDPGQPQATLTIRHRHPVAHWVGPCSQAPRYSATYEGMTERCYFDYVRVYAPSGAVLQHATPHPVPGSILLSGERQSGDVRVSQGELGKTVLATFLVLRPGESLETTFAYALPGAILERTSEGWRYQLTLQKQPGTDARRARVALRLPAGVAVVAADPPASERDQDMLIYDLDLRTDWELSVTWLGVGGG